jgi:2,3-bisphosphoglycerate-dependent phosphoglycerate mutase
MPHYVGVLFATTIFFLSLTACQSNKVDSLIYLQSVKNGQLIFADGKTESIQHWGDSSWTHIFCVRHAEKAKDDPKDPLLTPEGTARAERLGRILAESGLDSVYASPYRRTQLTAEPVQRRGNTPPVVTYRPDQQAEWLLTLMEQSKGKTLLIVGHQNTIPQLLNQLEGSLRYDNIPDLDFGRFYVVATRGIGKTEIMEYRY